MDGVPPDNQEQDAATLGVQDQESSVEGSVDSSVDGVPPDNQEQDAATLMDPSLVANNGDFRVGM